MGSNSEEYRSGIERLLLTCAKLLDERRFEEWVNLFTDDGVYKAVTHENFHDQGMLLFKDGGREALKERAAFVMGYYQFEHGKTLHVISNIEVQVETSDEATSNSYFVVYRTAAAGMPELYGCGEYRDRLVRERERWLFRERLVIVDNATLPANFAELL